MAPLDAPDHDRVDIVAEMVANVLSVAVEPGDAVVQEGDILVTLGRGGGIRTRG